MNHIPFPERPQASCIVTREHRLALYKQPKWYFIKIWVQGSWHPEIEHTEDLEALNQIWDSQLCFLLVEQFTQGRGSVSSTDSEVILPLWHLGSFWFLLSPQALFSAWSIPTQPEVSLQASLPSHPPPQESLVGDLTPVPQNVTAFRDRVLKRN